LLVTESIDLGSDLLRGLARLLLGDLGRMQRRLRYVRLQQRLSLGSAAYEGRIHERTMIENMSEHFIPAASSARVCVCVRVAFLRVRSTNQRLQFESVAPHSEHRLSPPFSDYTTSEGREAVMQIVRIKYHHVEGREGRREERNAAERADGAGRRAHVCACVCVCASADVHVREPLLVEGRLLTGEG
jgi:hypothetical protein